MYSSKLSLFFVLILVEVSFSACGSRKYDSAIADSSGEFLTMWQPSAPAIIYKTRDDYTNLVPVIMNAEKTRIVSYPDPLDLVSEGKLMKPVRLKHGYLLDNRGINERVAFLNITYDEYAKLNSPPHMVDLMMKIIDTNPLTVMYRCGNRSDYSNLIYELNVLIDRGLGNCEKVNLIPLSVELE